MADKLDKEIDDLIEDCAFGHNFDYLGREFKKLVYREKRKSLTAKRKKPYDMDWAELESFLEPFDHVDVSFSDGAVHPMFGGSSGVTVLRVTDVSPQKQAGGKTLLHISTDTNWFGPGVHRIFSDEQIIKIIEDTVAEFEFSGNAPHMDAAEKLKKAFGVGREPLPRYAPQKRNK